MVCIWVIDVVNISAIDLNLLVALRALLRERSVTRAAEIVGLSQPAMSHALKRLRDEFGDPLLVRAGRGMVLTPRGEEILDPLENALRQVESLYHPPGEFVAAESEQTFVIGANDYGQFVILPRLLERLSELAPGINVRVRDLGAHPLAARLESGELDLVLKLGRVEEIPETLYRRDLFQLELECMVRLGNSQVGDVLTLEDYTKLSHVLISQDGDDSGVVDWTLAEMGLKRRVAVVVPHFLIAPHIVARTDLVLTTASSVARVFADVLPVRLLSPPIELERGTVSMVWHPRMHTDAGQKWMRSQIEYVSGWLRS